MSLLFLFSIRSVFDDIKLFTSRKFLCFVVRRRALFGNKFLTLHFYFASECCCAKIRGSDCQTLTTVMA